MNKAITSALDEYNYYRAPEAIARLIDISGNYFGIRFEGAICFSCGFYDYFEDLLYVLARHGILSRIVEVIVNDDAAIVRYELLGLTSDC